MFRQLRIGFRLALAFGFLVILLAGLGGFSLYQTNALRTEMQAITDQRAPTIMTVNRLNELFQRTRIHTEAMIGASSMATRAPLIGRLVDTRDKLNKTQKTYEGLIRSDRNRELYARFKATEERFWEAHGKVISYAEKGQADRARQVRNDELEPVTEEMSEALNQLLDLQTVRVEQASTDADRKFASIRLAVMIAVAAAVLLTILLAVLITRSITGPRGGPAGPGWS